MNDYASGELSTGGEAARVTRTGLAVVHEGELILPAAGSEAQAEIVAGDNRAVVNYYFPVEIEVRVAPEQVDPQALVAQALRDFARALRNI